MRGFSGLFRRLAAAAARPSRTVVQTIDVAGQVHDITLDPGPLVQEDGGGWRFDLADGQSIYLAPPGVGCRFQTPPPNALTAPDARRLDVAVHARRPLPPGCRLWVFAYDASGQAAKISLGLSEPVSCASLDLPPQATCLGVAIQLKGRGVYRPDRLSIRIAARNDDVVDDTDLKARVDAALRDGRAAQAVAMLEMALDETRTTARLRRLATTLSAIGRNRRAVAVWDEILAQVDQASDLPLDLANARDEACNALSEQGDDQTPPGGGAPAVPPAPVVRVALSHLALGLRDQARDHLEQAFQEGVDPANAAWALAGLERQAGRLEAALRWVRAAQSVGGAAPGRDSLEPTLLGELGRTAEARAAADAAMARNPCHTTRLTQANLMVERDDRLAHINPLFADHGLAALRWQNPSAPGDLDNLTADAPAVADGPLVSVIVPAFNAAATLLTALRALAGQSWRNLEVLIVDDASADETVPTAQAFAARDARFRVITSARNGGPYQARNLGLEQARGDYVTCHDADDWSHPQRLQRHVEALIQRPDRIATLSRCVTATTDLVFTPRSSSASPFRTNLSSLMFRRQPVLAQAGYWDQVRFAGDGEFVARLQAMFRRHSVSVMADGPLSIVRQSPTTLTATAGGGLDRLGHTLRTEYRNRYRLWHAQGVTAPVARAPASRPFPVPKAMVQPASEPIEVDVVIASDFTLPGGATASNVEEVLANRAAGLRTGLIAMQGYRHTERHQMSAKVRRLIDDDRVQLITADQAVRCAVVICRWPPVLAGTNLGLPTVETDHLRIIANQTPRRSSAPDSQVVYDPIACDRNARAAFGADPVWAPIGPVARQSLAPFAGRLTLAADDWVNVLDLSQWRGADRPKTPSPGAVPVIGRHARDVQGKWPGDPDILRSVYPDDGSLDVRILGGAQVAADILGGVPSTWTVHDFDAVSPADFLRQLDVFVYFPDESLNEAFGRTIMEAMAAGVPVLLPSRFQAVFGDAAQYCAPHRVGDHVRALMADSQGRAELIAAGHAFVARHSHPVHIARLAALGVSVTH